MARRILSPLHRTRNCTNCSRALSTAVIHPPAAGARQLALPVAFIAVEGWDKQHGIESWDPWIAVFARAGYSSLLVSIDPTELTLPPQHTSKDLLSALESKLKSLLSSSASPFPPLLISSHLSTLLSQAYVSSHPLSGLLLHSPTPPTSAHSLYPHILPTPWNEFTFEPNFPIGVMHSEMGTPKGRLEEEFGDEEGDEPGEGWVQGLVGGKDEEGAERVLKWMDETGRL